MGGALVATPLGCSYKMCSYKYKYVKELIMNNTLPLPSVEAVKTKSLLTK